MTSAPKKKARSTARQRAGHQMVLSKEKPPAAVEQCRIAVEKLHPAKGNGGGGGDGRWKPCAKAPNMEAVERHARSCGGMHRVARRGQETILTYDDRLEQLDVRRTA